MENRSEVFRELLAEDQIMILTHKSPDGDTLGTAFALCSVLKRLGKKAFVACSDSIPAKFQFLTGGRDMLPVEFEPEVLVSVDVAAVTLLGDALSVYADRIGYCIDHHPSNTGYAKKTIVDPAASSAGELLFDLLAEAGISLEISEAKSLYAAISFDTGCFKYSNVTPGTHRAAAALLQFGFDAEPMNRQMFDIASEEQLHMEAEAIRSVECFRDNAVVMAALPFEKLEHVSDTVDFDFLASVPRRIEGSVVGISMRESEKDVVKVSLRSTNDRMNVSDIAAVFGGGGHKRASGCLLRLPFGEAKTLLLNEVLAVYDRVFRGEK